MPRSVKNSLYWEMNFENIDDCRFKIGDEVVVKLPLAATNAKTTIPATVVGFDMEYKSNDDINTTNILLSVSDEIDVTDIARGFTTLEETKAFRILAKKHIKENFKEHTFIWVHQNELTLETTPKTLQQITNTLIKELNGKA